MSKWTTFVVLMNMIPLTVFFQLIIIPTFFPHLIGAPVRWVLSTVFSAGWNIVMYIGLKIRDRNIAKEQGY